MYKRSLLSALAFLLISAKSAYATDMQSEIKHLLAYIADTSCLYERNGTTHTGPDAVLHINKKYAHFKDDIDSTERFIELSATKSTISGQYYYIVCQGKPKIKSQLWLLQELQKFRRMNP